MLISALLDLIGDQYGAWHYRYQAVPTLPTYFPWDFALMPVAVMTFLQVKPKTNPWIKAIIFALCCSYIAEPLFQWVDIYNPIRWRWTYSVPIQMAIYMLSHFIYQKRFRVEK